MKTRSSAHLVTITNVNPLQTSSDRDDASKLLSEPWLHQHQRKSRTSSRLLGMHQCHIPANQRSLQGRKNWNRFLSRTLGWDKHIWGHRYHRSEWHNAVCMDRNVVVFRSISLHHYISWCHRYRPTPLDTVPAIALVNAMLNSLVLRFQCSLLRTGSQKKERKGGSRMSWIIY
jgi:hypothetical protein